MAERLGKYELIEEVGQGGYATVYRARHITLGSEVALKVLLPELAADPDTRQRFISGAQVGSRLEHPAIVRIFDLVEEPDGVFIAMEYMPGGDLRRWREENPRAGWREIVPLLHDTARALDYTGAQGILHRDVKPSNILLDANGWAHLCDFGLVRVAGSPHLTQLGSVVGTATYMSPEQAEGKELDPRSDQYALAVVAYELLAGRPPFVADRKTAVLVMHVTQPPPLPSELGAGVPPEVDDILLRALAKGPEERYPSCVEFVHSLETALASSELRRFRELLAGSQERMAAGDYRGVEDLLNQAARLAPDEPEWQHALADLETARYSAAAYQELLRDWQTAAQQAANVLAVSPDYPDEAGIFPVLGLRPAGRKRPTAREIRDQTLLGLALGIPAALAALYFAFRWITRP